LFFAKYKLDSAFSCIAHIRGLACIKHFIVEVGSTSSIHPTDLSRDGYESRGGHVIQRKDSPLHGKTMYSAIGRKGIRISRPAGYSTRVATHIYIYLREKKQEFERLYYVEEFVVCLSVVEVSPRSKDTLSRLNTP